MLTVLLTSPRVAPGLLTWQAWSALRSAARVLAAADHPLLPALAAAGVSTEIIDGSPGSPGSAALAARLDGAAAADGPVVWLAPPGEHPAGEHADNGLSGQFLLLHGSHDLPGAHLLDVVAVMDTLRTSCPWDREQTHSSLLRYLLEEAYETVETVEGGDLMALREELGDVLLQVAFHARIAAERGQADEGFTIDDVADVLVAKLKRRHPHVFGSVSVSSAGDVSANWEDIKKAERSERAVATGSRPPSVLDGVAFGQPALSLAAQVQRRAGRAGVPFGAGPAGPGDLGDELMRLVTRASVAGEDPELALRAAARRLAEQVREWERTDRGNPGE